MNLHHPEYSELDLPSVLHALSDPQRLRIVHTLATTEGPCQCRAFGLEITKSTLTHHLRVLREAGVITQTCVGTSKLNTLRDADLDTRFPGLLTAVLAVQAPREVAGGPVVERSVAGGPQQRLAVAGESPAHGTAPAAA
jgi:DNA-binding transcriptional ArsR family regulator